MNKAVFVYYCLGNVRPLLAWVGHVTLILLSSVLEVLSLNSREHLVYLFTRTGERIPNYEFHL
jgi:hypothetical protein